MVRSKGAHPLSQTSEKLRAINQVGFGVGRSSAYCLRMSIPVFDSPIGKRRCAFWPPASSEPKWEASATNRCNVGVNLALMQNWCRAQDLRTCRLFVMDCVSLRHGSAPAGHPAAIVDRNSLTSLQYTPGLIYSDAQRLGPAWTLSIPAVEDEEQSIRRSSGMERLPEAGPGQPEISLGDFGSAA